MAGFFGLFNYAKPGKGVSKDAPEKKRFFLFFELYFRKFWKLMLLNLMLAVIYFPFISFFVIWLFSAFGVEATAFADNLTMYVFTMCAFGIPSPFNYILIGLSAALMGPATAAATYIWRQFARQEHAWVWSDFWERMRSNFRQSFVAGIIDILIWVSMVLYMSMNFSGNTALGQYLYIFRYAAIIVFIVYTIMRFYTYLIMVTFEMPLVSIYRNAWIFSVLGFVRNLCTILFTGLVTVATIFVPLPMMLILTFSLCGFITTFNAYPVVEKYMLRPRQENQDGTVTILESEEKPVTESLFSDDVSARHSPAAYSQDDVDAARREVLPFSDNAPVSPDKTDAEPDTGSDSDSDSGSDSDSDSDSGSQNA